MNKRELGKYYTQTNPFIHPLFKQWMDLIDINNTVFIEPFAGENNILKLLSDSGFELKWKSYDIEPPIINNYPNVIVEYRDTIKNFPKGFDACITNCPYLSKSSAKRRKIFYPWKEDDIYKTCLNIMLNNCKFVAAIIPESFITARIHLDRLWGIISLTCKMFNDTDCPVCMALFTPEGNNNVKVYANESYLGTLENLRNCDLTGYTSDNKWVFNDKNGNLGAKTVDSQKKEDCKFFYGENINPDLIKVSSRSFTRISGLPKNINRDEFIKKCNEILSDYRKSTKDIMLTSFKGLRKDGKYRRRLDFKTIKFILNKALKELS